MEHFIVISYLILRGGSGGQRAMDLHLSPLSMLAWAHWGAKEPAAGGSTPIMRVKGGLHPD